MCIIGVDQMNRHWLLSFILAGEGKDQRYEIDRKKKKWAVFFDRSHYLTSLPGYTFILEFPFIKIRFLTQRMLIPKDFKLVKSKKQIRAVLFSQE
jgi:hypothetical protein